MIQVDLIAFASDLVGQALLIILLGLTGFCLHETTHYWAALRSTTPDEVNLHFKHNIPGAVSIKTASNFDDADLKLFSVAPTLLFFPLFVFSLITVGPPSKYPLFDGTLNTGNVYYLAYYLMLGVAMFPSPSDLLGLFRTTQVRGFIEREETFSNIKALRLLFTKGVE
jgi:hypothetical protein